MPHITLEYTDNLSSFDLALALRSINRVSIDCGLFREKDIKSRSRCVDSWQVGAGSENCAFIHVRISMLSGRQPEMRQRLAKQVMDELIRIVGDASGTELQLSVETAEIDRSSYAKVTHNG